MDPMDGIARETSSMYLVLFPFHNGQDPSAAPGAPAHEIVHRSGMQVFRRKLHNPVPVPDSRGAVKGYLVVSASITHRLERTEFPYDVILGSGWTNHRKKACALTHASPICSIGGRLQP